LLPDPTSEPAEVARKSFVTFGQLHPVQIEVDDMAHVDACPAMPAIARSVPSRLSDSQQASIRMFQACGWRRQAS